MVAKRKEEGKVRQNGEDTEIHKALEKDQFSFNKEKTDAANICTVCFITHWCFINKLWFAVKKHSEWFIQSTDNNYKENRPNFGSKRMEKATND